MRRIKKMVTRRDLFYPFLLALVLFFLAPPQSAFGGGAASAAPDAAAAKAVGKPADGPGAVEVVAEKAPKKHGSKTLLIVAVGVVVAAIVAYFLFFAKKTGSINVQSTPTGAKILLDGVDTGQVTPALLTKVKNGLHTVTLKKDGFDNLDIPVTVSGGKTVTALGELLAAAISVNFDDGRADHWANNGYGTWQVVGGVYRFSGSGSGGEYAYSWYDLGDFTDFTFRAKIRNGGDQGMAFRGNPTTGDWYILYAWGGQWAVFRMTGNMLTRLVDYSPSMALRYYPEWNIFKVVAKGANFGFYFNDILVGSAYDTTMSRGKIGFQVRNYAGVTMEVDDVSVELHPAPAADFSGNAPLFRRH